MLHVIFTYILIFGLSSVSYADQSITAAKIDTPVSIDGIADDSQWKKASSITVFDPVAAIKIKIKSVHTDDSIFFLVSYPDPSESRQHKTWKWSKEKEIYIMGPEREDAFIFKFNMKKKPVDLSIHANNAYESDIWYWKADRTDPSGFADDKIQILSLQPSLKTRKLIHESGNIYYLTRKGDAGSSSYKNTIHTEYIQERMPHFSHLTPTGSRADITAKGKWHNEEWTIEFGRKLVTGYGDDIAFTKPGKFQFGISRYEIAGRPPEKRSDQPLFGTGDTGENLTLIIP